MSENPSAVAENVVVGLEYTLTVDGNIIDSTQGNAPLEYLQGHQNIITGLERELAGLSVGQTREVFVRAADAYGEYNPQAVIQLERSQLPPDYRLEIGGRLRVRDDDGRVYTAAITAFDDQNLSLDLNHPLAGKDLYFTATVVSLRGATEDEISAGRVGGCASCGSSAGCSGACA